MKQTPDLKRCASCGEPRGNRTDGWDFRLRDDVAVSVTCPNCPTWREPIRRIGGKGGIRWRAVVDMAPPGQPRKQATRTFQTLTAARAWVEDVRDEVRREGRYGRPETVDELLDRWLETLRVRDVTIAGYKSALRSIRAKLGTVPVIDLTIADISSYIGWALDEGGLPRTEGGDTQPLAPRTIRQGIGALARAIDLAVAEERGVTRNVARLAKLPGAGRAAGKDLEHWTPEELATFAAAADMDPMAGFWRLSLSGLTRSEICGLRWSDIDMGAGVVTIAQARVRVDANTSQIGPPKSKQRERTVPFEELWPGSVVLLERIIANQAERRRRYVGWGDGSDLAVLNELGEPIRPDWWGEQFARLVRAAGVRKIRLHGLRHSLALAMLEANVNPADAAALLGHRLEVFLGTYAPDTADRGIARAVAGLSARLEAARSA